MKGLSANHQYILMTKPAQSVNRVSRKGARIEKKKTIRQHYNSPASAEAEAGLLFSSLLLYHLKDMQIMSVLGQKTNKAINNVHNHSF